MTTVRLLFLSLLVFPCAPSYGAPPEEPPSAVLNESLGSAIVGEAEWRRLVASLSTGTLNERQVALRGFTDRDVASAAPILLWYVRHTDADLSSTARFLLPSVVELEPRLIDPLRELVVDPRANEKSRLAAIEALARLRPSPPSVLKTLRDVAAGRGPLSAQCVGALGRADQSAVPHLLYLARQAPPDLFNPLTSALLSVDAETLRRELSAAHGSYRTLLVSVIARSEPLAAVAVQELLACLGDESLVTRQLAVEAIATSGVTSSEVRARMLTLLERDFSVEVRVTSLDVLAHCKNDDGKVTRSLARATQTDKEPAVRLAAARLHAGLTGNNTLLRSVIAAELARQDEETVLLTLHYVMDLKEGAAEFISPIRSLRGALASRGRTELVKEVDAVLEHIQR